MAKANVDVEVLSYDEYKVTIEDTYIILTRAEVETLAFYLSSAMKDADHEEIAV